MLICGTPTGAGARLEPPKWLKPGDIIEVKVDGVLQTFCDRCGDALKIAIKKDSKLFKNLIEKLSLIHI